MCLCVSVRVCVCVCASELAVRCVYVLLSGVCDH